MTIKAEMVQRGGSEFWVVSCISSGGRPETDISLALNTDEELQRENDTDSDVETISALLPAAAYEGRNVTCVFDHPKFTHKVSQVVTLPSFREYYLCFMFEKLMLVRCKSQKTELCFLFCRSVRSSAVVLKAGKQPC